MVPVETTSSTAITELEIRLDPDLAEIMYGKVASGI